MSTWRVTAYDKSEQVVGHWTIYYRTESEAFGEAEAFVSRIAEADDWTMSLLSDATIFDLTENAVRREVDWLEVNQPLALRLTPNEFDEVCDYITAKFEDIMYRKLDGMVRECLDDVYNGRE